MKIFGIGLSKTGTTSLAAALAMLGYRTKDFPGVTTYTPGDLASIDPLVLEQNDALTDTPIPSFYRELDEHYPGAKFILTVRDMDGWLLSCKKQFTAKQAEKHETNNRVLMDLYGTAVFDEAMFRLGYQRFVNGVIEHFKDRPQDLLVLDVAAGQGWSELCAFLDKPVPAMPFPKANVTRINWMDLQELVSIAMEAGQEVLRAHRRLAPASSEDDRPALISALLRKGFQTLGGRPAALEAATSAAQKVLVQRLARLNAEIPFVSRLAPAVPASERSRWNHLWVIDPLDGEPGFGEVGGEFTVNLALIEDQKPIAGVVHSPLSGLTYYAMVGKGAFKAVGDGPATRLGGSDSAPPSPAAPAAHDPPSKALALCRLVESGGKPDAGILESMEWHTAAPHAIARLIGRHLVTVDGSAELAYNKPDLRNPPIRVV